VKARLTVTDENGVVFEGEVELAPVNATAPQTRGTASRGGPATRPEATRTRGAPPTPDFSLPVRAFMNRYARNRTGPQAFTLLVARLAEGEVGREVRVDQIRREWSRISGILGGSFAPVYGTRAKTEAWVDSPKRGAFVLLPDWTGALGGEAE